MEWARSRLGSGEKWGLWVEDRCRARGNGGCGAAGAGALGALGRAPDGTRERDTREGGISKEVLCNEGADACVRGRGARRAFGD